jgi:hypothetical protein
MARGPDEFEAQTRNSKYEADVNCQNTGFKLDCRGLLRRPRNDLQWVSACGGVTRGPDGIRDVYY